MAREYYDCLTAASIPVTLTNNGIGELAVVSFTGDQFILYDGSADGGGSFPTQGLTADQQEQRNQLLASPHTEPYLMIGGTDYSAAYAACHKASAYDLVTSGGDPSTPLTPTLLAEQELTVQSSNAWAACARANGWPDIQDTHLPNQAGDGLYPSPIVIPNSISLEQLRALLVTCPNFDDTMADLDRQWQTSHSDGSHPEGYLPSPSIDIEHPGAATDQATLDHVTQLTAILSEKMDLYYANDGR